MFGLLGKKLGHSFSKKVHESFIDIEYKLFETDNLDVFFKNSKINGINITIPYKFEVIPYLDKLSKEAEETNAVNTVINNGGKLIGYNTDYYGMLKALNYYNISLQHKNIIIMGNGATSRTINYICLRNKAKNIYVLARNPNKNEHFFNDVDNLENIDIIFNATPVGMFPVNNDDPLIDLRKCPNLSSVIDVVYNPLRSNLLIQAEMLDIKTVNGLFMLISQAVKSIELFHNIIISDVEIEKYYKKLLFQSLNLVFIGMPMSGKSFLSKRISQIYNIELIDIDDEIEKLTNESIENIFKINGEPYFRNLEKEQIVKHYKQHNKAISCGGGIVLNPNNITMLKQNGLIIFIDTPLHLLKTKNPKNRPLLRNSADIEKLYNKRRESYLNSADIVIKRNDFNETATLKEIEVKIDEYISSKWS